LKKRPIIITTTNAITIPKKVRNLLDLQPGDCLDYEVMANGSIILVRKECCDLPSLRPTCKLPAMPKNVNNLIGWRKGLLNPFSSSGVKRK
jgi:AbrB family looped-hinge helix DNA binding protein